MGTLGQCRRALPDLHQIRDERPSPLAAGRFERCVRVRGSGTLKLYADGTAGWRDMPLTTLE